MSRSYSRKPQPVTDQRWALRYGVKSYRYGFCGSSHRRQRKPHRSCGVCHLEKVLRMKAPRDIRLTQDSVPEGIEQYFSERQS